MPLTKEQKQELITKYGKSGNDWGIPRSKLLF